MAKYWPLGNKIPVLFLFTEFAMNGKLPTLNWETEISMLAVDGDFSFPASMNSFVKNIKLSHRIHHDVRFSYLQSKYHYCGKKVHPLHIYFDIHYTSIQIVPYRNKDERLLLMGNNVEKFPSSKMCWSRLRGTSSRPCLKVNIIICSNFEQFVNKKVKILETKNCIDQIGGM